MDTACLYHSGIETELKALCNKINLHMEKMQIQFNMIEKSIEDFRRTVDHRLESTNEFRNQLSDQAATFVTKREIELISEKIDNRIVYLEKNKSLHEGSTIWTNHIITVLISVFVTSVVMLIGPIMMKVITK